MFFEGAEFKVNLGEENQAQPEGGEDKKNEDTNKSCHTLLFLGLSDQGRGQYFWEIYKFHIFSPYPFPE